MLGVGAVLGAVVLFALTAFWAARKISSPADMFTTDKRLGSMVSIIVGNVTLGTGLVYYLNLLGEGWISAMALPLGVLIGYQVLAAGLRHLAYSPRPGRELYQYLLERDGENWSALLRAFLPIVIIIYIFLVAFELYVSAPLIAGTMGLDGDSNDTLSISIGLGIAAAVYAVTGGLRGVVLTDWFQATFLAAMLVGLLLIVAAPEQFGIALNADPQGAVSKIRAVGIQVDSWVLPASVACAAISTQFYNVINIGMASNFRSEEAARQLVHVGWILPLTFVLTILLGALLPIFAGSDTVELPRLVNQVSTQSTWYSQSLAVLIIVGMIGVLMSTVDSAVILISKLIYGRRLDSVESLSASEKQSELTRVRFIVGTASAFSIGIFVVLFQEQPAIIGLLLTFVLPLTLAGPMIASAIFSRQNSHTPIFIRPWFSLGFVVVLGVSWAFGLHDAIKGDGSLSRKLTTYGWGIITAIGLVDYLSARWRSRLPI